MPNELSLSPHDQEVDMNESTQLVDEREEVEGRQRFECESTTVVATVNSPIDRAHGRTVAKRMFLAGFLLLPWLWIVNIWYFYPHLYLKCLSSEYAVRLQRCFGWSNKVAKSRTQKPADPDPEIQKYARRSLYSTTLFSIIFSFWIVIYSIGGSSLLGQETYESLNLSQNKIIGSILQELS